MSLLFMKSDDLRAGMFCCSWTVEEEGFPLGKLRCCDVRGCLEFGNCPPWAAIVLEGIGRMCVGTHNPYFIHRNR